VEGQNIHVERRFANGRLETLQPLAEELVRAQVEIIVTGGTPATLAAMRATAKIPIVFRSAGDPVLLGLVASLARPGGNVTGFSKVSPGIIAKYMSVLQELLPGLERIGILLQMDNPYDRAVRARFEQVCQSLALVPIVVEIGAAGQISDAIVQLERKRAQALVLGSATGFLWDHRFEIFGGATKHGLPTMVDDTALVREAGALIAYGYLQSEEDRVRAEHIDRILRGAKPADLPVQQPKKFELVINLNTAKGLGLTIPQSLLLRADEVIQ
jgi:putative ABC transport system substrate-binding protein